MSHGAGGLAPEDEDCGPRDCLDDARRELGSSLPGSWFAKGLELEWKDAMDLETERLGVPWRAKWFLAQLHRRDRATLRLSDRFAARQNGEGGGKSD